MRENHMTNEKYNTKFKEHILLRLEMEYGYSKETSMYTYQMYDSIARIARLRAKAEHGFSKKNIIRLLMKKNTTCSSNMRIAFFHRL